LLHGGSWLGMNTERGECREARRILVSYTFVKYKTELCGNHAMCMSPFNFRANLPIFMTFGINVMPLEPSQLRIF
jgi:hypothetical protein